MHDHFNSVSGFQSKDFEIAAIIITRDNQRNGKQIPPHILNNSLSIWLSNGITLNKQCHHFVLFTIKEMHRVRAVQKKQSHFTGPTQKCVLTKWIKIVNQTKHSNIPLNINGGLCTRYDCKSSAIHNTNFIDARVRYFFVSSLFLLISTMQKWKKKKPFEQRFIFGERFSCMNFANWKQFIFCIEFVCVAHSRMNKYHHCEFTFCCECAFIKKRTKKSRPYFLLHLNIARYFVPPLKISKTFSLLFRWNPPFNGI